MNRQRFVRFSVLEKNARVLVEQKSVMIKMFLKVVTPVAHSNFYGPSSVKREV